MMGSVFNRLEIDVMQLAEVQEAVGLAHKYKFPAIIVHPGLSSEAIIARSRAGAKFKIITPIDWPKGEIFGTTKMRGLSLDSLETDGFEFLLTPNKTEIETRNEARVLTEFVKQHLPDSIEIRFVLGTSLRTEDNINTMCRGLTSIRTPSLIRTDIQLKLQVNRANPEEHNRIISNIQSIIKAPIKVSGNVNNLKTIAACHGVSRFAVNLVQAKNIIKEFTTQPDQLKELLSSQITTAENDPATHVVENHQD